MSLVSPPPPPYLYIDRSINLLFKYYHGQTSMVAKEVRELRNASKKLVQYVGSICVVDVLEFTLLAYSNQSFLS